MSYLVLARKWRPRSFDTLVGQEHVVRALTHALETQRLHHAWLFTGTRGVGKTTLSRILAKALNCEQGITANPCGQCSACTEIDAGRFVDYIELDAASNRGVDEMTQLLEQAVYSPSSGRFKVYMIDEVHMLSGHAFNAMLKTLEEPPPHVKFILATTDPQKIPVTVLSRCLQFNLKQMTADGIIGYLESVLGQENIPYEATALRLLARAASGSMRDALSLTDQAISYSAGSLTSDAIQSMLGTIDQSYLTNLLEGLAQASAPKVIEVANALATMGLSYSAALDDLAVLLSRIAIEQRVPGSVPASDTAAEQIKNLAQLLSTDMVQLFYSVAVHSRSELSLAPDEYSGFVMACFRMIALLPPGTEKKSPEPITKIEVSAQAQQAEVEQPVKAEVQEVITAQVTAQQATEPELESESIDLDAYSAYASNPEDPYEKIDSTDNGLADIIQPDASFEQTVKNIKKPAKAQSDKIRPLLTDLNSDAWPMLVKQLPLSGAAAELARQSEFIKLDGNLLYLRMGVDVLGETSARSHLATVLSEHYGVVVRLDIEYAQTGSSTAFAIDQAHLEKLQQQALNNVKKDAFINELITEFQAYVVKGSVKPVL